MALLSTNSKHNWIEIWKTIIEKTLNKNIVKKKNWSWIGNRSERIVDKNLKQKNKKENMNYN